MRVASCRIGILWLGSLVARRSNAFQTINHAQGRRIAVINSQLPPSIQETSSELEERGPTVDPPKSELKFVGKINQVSNPLPYTSRDDVVAFFTCPQNRNMFITAGGKRECKMIPMNPEILEQWTRISHQEGGSVPEPHDEVFTVRTGGVKFPGLTLETSATMGIKFIEEDIGPKYEVTLIGDERKVTGLPPVVYLFNRLTGGGGENGTSNSLSTTYILCDFSQEDSKVIFKTDTILTVTIRFPSILLKILPTNKEKAEEQGSQAITKAVAKDVAASMTAYEEAYRKMFC